MSERARGSRASRPTADQVARFRKLTPEQRLHWLLDTLVLCHELATPEAKAQWRKHKDSRR
jgi:hypothetical protein